MTWLRRALDALRNLVRQRRAEDDLDAEIAAFFETSIAHKMQSGMSRDAATRAARIEFGSVAVVKDGVRDVG